MIAMIGVLFGWIVIVAMLVIAGVLVIKEKIEEKRSWIDSDGNFVWYEYKFVWGQAGCYGIRKVYHITLKERA